MSRRAFLETSLLCALAAAAGCDRFRGENHGTPRILRAMAYDATRTLPPVVTADDPDPRDMRLTEVPLEHARFRIEIDKPLDGSTIQLEPGADLCAPSSNIALTRDGVPATAEVCYEPGGTSPSITISPATLTCRDGAALPGADGTLQSGSTYVVTGTGIRDLDGHALDFRLTIVAAIFAPARLLAETSYDASGAVAGTADLAAGSASVPPGIADTATGLFTTPTYSRDPGADADAERSDGSGFAALYYGSGFSAVFPSLMPGPGSEPDAGIDVAGALRVGGHPVEVGLVGDQAQRDRLHLVPRLPLEDGAAYSLVVAPPQGGHIADALGNTTASTLGPFSFATPAAAQRVMWQYPVDGEEGVYPVLDERLQAAWSGRPFLGIATGRPFTSATAELVGPDGTPVPDLEGAPYAGDGRARTVSLRSTAADTLALAPGTVYTMRWTVNGAITGSSSFRTLDFANDARWPGFAGQVKQFASLADGHAPITAGAVGVPVASHGQAVPYLLTVTGRVARDDQAPPMIFDGPAGASQASKYAFSSLAAGDVKLYRGQPGPNNEVPIAAGGGMKGYARTFFSDASLGRDPWTDGAYPGSLVGVVPQDPLDFGQVYTLVADVRLANANPDGNGVHVELPFTTTTFRVIALVPPDTASRWSGANPLVLQTTGVLDPAALGTPSGLDGPVQVFAGGAQIPIVASTPAAGQPGENQWIVVRPMSDDDVPFATTHTVIATPTLQSRGASLERFSGSFTTPPERDAQGGLVCR
jgi:hypothetical protein